MREIPENEINEIRERERDLIVLGGSEGITEERDNEGEAGRSRLGIVDEDGQGEIVEVAQKEGKGGKGEIVADRKYFKRVPDKLSNSEYEFEMEERECRRKNIMIRGIRMVGTGLKEEVRKVFKNFLNIDVYIKRIRAIGGGLLAEL